MLTPKRLGSGGHTKYLDVESSDSNFELETENQTKHIKPIFQIE